jgi:DnaJ-class molecular chaperone
MSKGDVSFILQEKTHDVFKREKSNLIYTASISIKDALIGANLKIPLITGIE